MYSSVSTIWVLLGAALVFLMQAGFAMCEAGFTRAKNTGNILMKNLMDFCIGTPVYWLLGFGLMVASGGALIGGLDPMVQGDYSAILPEGVPLFAYLIFQTVFCATSASIAGPADPHATKAAADNPAARDRTVLYKQLFMLCLIFRFRYCMRSDGRQPSSAYHANIRNITQIRQPQAAFRPRRVHLPKTRLRAKTLFIVIIVFYRFLLIFVKPFVQTRYDLQ